MDYSHYTDAQIEDAWRVLVEIPVIAGPWIGYRGKCYRYSHTGQPLACASYQEEIQLEDKRLQTLGYLLTDKNRHVPDGWFF